MKIICSKQSLLNSIHIVQKAISSNTPYPILTGILFDARENLVLTGYDTEITIQCTTDCVIEKQGSIVIDSKTISDIIGKLPDADIFIEVKEDNNVHIDCRKSHFEIKGINAESYPSIEEVEKAFNHKMKKETLKNMIRQTIFATGKDDNKPILMGEMIEKKDGKLTVVAIDGYRMALRNDFSEEGEDFKVVIPEKTLKQIIGIIQNSEDYINIYLEETQILFEFDNCKVSSRLINGDYLDYNNILPKEYNTTVFAVKADLLSAVERASLIIEEGKKHPIMIKVEENEMIIYANTEIGTVKEEIDVGKEGLDLEIGFNSLFLLETLKVIDDERIKIEFTTAVSPCVMSPVEGEEYKYLVLPVRTKSE